MAKVAIKSTVKLRFPPRFEGFVEMRIKDITNSPEEERYRLLIVDTCYDYEDIENEIYEDNYDPDTGEGLTKEVVRTRVDYHEQIRERFYSYSELSILGKMLNLDKSKFKDETEYINELFTQGLLLMTQKECMDNISGPGLGMYFSKVNEWVINRE